MSRKFFLIYFVLSCILAVPTSAQLLTINVTQSDALSIAKRQFQGQDVDYSNGIESVAVDSRKDMIVNLKSASPANAFVYVTSLFDGTVKAYTIIPAGEKSVSIDISTLAGGMYGVTYYVNSEIIDQIKLNVK